MPSDTTELARELVVVTKRLTDLQYEIKQEKARIKDILALLDEHGDIDLQALQEAVQEESGGPQRRRPTTRIGKVGGRESPKRRRRRARRADR